MPIPKIIHQIWLGDQSLKPIKLMETTKNVNKYFTYMLWTEKELFIEKRVKLINENVLRLLNPAQYIAMSDIIRYDILYIYGGIYVDADFEFINPIDDFLLNNSFFGVYENTIKYKYNTIANGIFGCTPKHPILKELVLNLKYVNLKGVHNLNAFQFIGPYYFTKHIKKYINQTNDKSVKILEPHYFFKYHFDKTLCYPENQKIDKVYAEHHWNHSEKKWLSY